MGLFSKKKPPLLGLDISSTAIKLLELSSHSSRKGPGYRVESYAVEPLAENAVADRKINDVEAVGNAIKNVVKKSRSRAKHAAVAVSGSSVITKVINMPVGLSDKELEMQIQLEADQYIPFPIEEVNLDFDVIGPSEKNPDMLDVLLAGSRSENVDDRVAAIEMGGLVPEVVDVEAYAMELAYRRLMAGKSGDADIVAIADIGSTTTTLSVIHEENVVYTREQNFGGKQLTEEIQRRYGLSTEEAGMAKRQGGLPDNYVTEVLEPFKDAMVQQINRAVQFFFSASSFNSINKVLLAGGASSISGIDDLVQDRLGVETAVANPFVDMSVASRVNLQHLTSDAPALMIACGLALRGIE